MAAPNRRREHVNRYRNAIPKTRARGNPEPRLVARRTPAKVQLYTVYTLGLAPRSKNFELTGGLSIAFTARATHTHLLHRPRSRQSDILHATPGTMFISLIQSIIPKGHPHSISQRPFMDTRGSEQSEHSPALMTTSYSTRQRARQGGRPGKPIERNRDEVRRARPVLRLERP